jgi:hypothetical protein
VCWKEADKRRGALDLQINGLFCLSGMTYLRRSFNRGSGTKNVIFQMALISFLSVLTCSSRCKYDILKVWLKKK